MSDARWSDPREYGERDLGDERRRVYDERDRDDHDPRDALMHDLDLPFGEQRELVVDRIVLAGLPSRSSPEGRAAAGEPHFRELEPVRQLAAAD